MREAIEDDIGLVFPFSIILFTHSVFYFLYKKASMDAPQG